MVISIDSLCSPLQLISEVNNGLVHSSLSCLMWLGQMQRWESTACHGCGLIQVPNTWINIHLIMSLSGRSGRCPNLKQDKGKNTLAYISFASYKFLLLSGIPKLVLTIFCNFFASLYLLLSNSHELVNFKYVSFLTQKLP